MIKPGIIIRADGNAVIGMGHIHRMLAFASYLCDFFEIHFFVNNPDKLVSELIENNGYKLTALKKEDYYNPESFISLIDKNALVVLDGYEFKTDYQQSLRNAGLKTLAIDDLNNWENVTDAVLNHGFSGEIKNYKVASHTKLYTGFKYAVVKKELLEPNLRSIRKSVSNVLICIGGTDPENYSERIVSNLLKESNKKLSLLTYPLNKKFDCLKSLAEKNTERLSIYHSLDTKAIIKLIQQNDIAVLQPSNIALEAAAIGIKIYVIQTAENQKYIKETLLRTQCAEELTLNDLSGKINTVMIENVNEQIQLQKKLFDGKSPGRILTLINELFLSVRKAEVKDTDLVYAWNNDEITRANSYQKEKIEYESHVKWFHQKIKDTTTAFYILEFNGIPAGCVRMDNKQSENIIGITVAPDFRGKKLATPMLNLSVSEFHKLFPSNKITAFIKHNNIVSLHAFKSAGFEIVEEGMFFGEMSYKLIK